MTYYLFHIYNVFNIHYNVLHFLGDTRLLRKYIAPKYLVLKVGAKVPWANTQIGENGLLFFFAPCQMGIAVCRATTTIGLRSSTSTKSSIYKTL